MRTHLYLIAIGAILLPSLNATAAGPTVNHLSGAVASRIETAAQELLAKDSVPGLEMAVVYNGETVFEGGFGFADPQAQTVRGPDTAFQIDSVTKSFTAMAALKLVEDGKVSLDDPISKYVQVPNESWKPITVRTLLSMTSGIPTGGAMAGSYTQIIDRVSSEQAALGPGLAFQPGSQYQYSNLNYLLLGEMVAQASGQSYIDYLTANILKPFGLDHTGFLSFDSLQDKAIPYIDGSRVKPRDPMSGFSAGGLTSTMHDLENFAAGLYRRIVLKPESYQLMWTRGTLPNGDQIPWGMGWEIRGSEVNHYATVFAKNGSGYGWAAQFNYYADKGVTVIVVTNSAAKNISGLCLAAAKAVTG